MLSGGAEHHVIECVVPADICLIGTSVNEDKSFFDSMIQTQNNFCKTYSNIVFAYY